MTRLNITLPDEIAKKLADKHNKSRFIAQVLKERFELEKRKKIGCLLTEGYKVVSNEDREICGDWRETEIEKWS